MVLCLKIMLNKLQTYYCLRTLCPRPSLFAQDYGHLSTEQPQLEQRPLISDSCGEVEDDGVNRLIDKLKDILAETKHCPMLTATGPSPPPSCEEVTWYTAANLWP